VNRRQTVYLLMIAQGDQTRERVTKREKIEREREEKTERESETEREKKKWSKREKKKK
jgi:hypothetical protein